MKKISILIAVFAMVAAASEAKAQYGEAGSRTSKGVSYTALLQMSGREQNDEISLPSPALGKHEANTGSSGMGLQNGKEANSLTPVPTMKQFLNTLRQEERLAFLDGLTMVNGRLVLGAGRQAVAGDKVLRFRDLLKDVPADINNEFLEGMAFKDGLLVSAYVGGLRKVMGEKDVKALIASLIPDTNARASMADSRSLCMGGTCDNATCSYNGHGYGCYDTFANSTCTSSCK